MGRLVDTDDLMKYAFGNRKGLIHTADIDKCPIILGRQSVQPEPCEDAVSRAELLSAFPVDDEPTVTKSSLRMTIKHLPSVTPKRKTGKWITQQFGSWAECSVCRELYDVPIAQSNFCPNCGAEMNGGEQDDT